MMAMVSAQRAAARVRGPRACAARAGAMMLAPPPPQNAEWKTVQIDGQGDSKFEYHRGYGGGKSDFDIWLGDRVPDGCYSPTAFGTVADAEKQCGNRVAAAGTVLAAGPDEPIGTMVANGRNRLFLRTYTASYDVNKGVIRETKIAMKMLASAENPKALCSYAGVFRQGYLDGIADIPIAHHVDPMGWILQGFVDNTMLEPGEEGNEFVIVPQAKQLARAAPYPKLKLTALPFQIDLMHTPSECSSADLVKNKSAICYVHNVTSTQLDAISFSVNVRTDPRLKPQYSEVIGNCDYASELDERRWFQPLDGVVRSAAAPPPSSGGLGLGLAAAIGVWLVRRPRRRR